MLAAGLIASLFAQPARAQTQAQALTQNVRAAPAFFGADAAAAVLAGPLALRSRAPLYDNRLAYRPGPTLTPGPGRARLQFTLSHVNTWAQMPGYFFDGEWTRAELRLGVGVGTRTEVTLDAGLMGRSGGVLDGAIESFHRAFGITQSRRDRYPRDRLHVARIDAAGAAEVLGPRDAGVGQLAPTLGLRHVLWREGARRALLGEVSLRLPLGARRRGFAAGGVDLGMGLRLAAPLAGPLDVHLASGLLVGPTTADVYGMAPSRVQRYLFAALTLALGTRTQLALQYINQDGVIERDAFRPLNLTTHEFALGVRVRVTRRVAVELGLIENSIHDANTPDVGGHVGLVAVP